MTGRKSARQRREEAAAATDATPQKPKPDRKSREKRPSRAAKAHAAKVDDLKGWNVNDRALRQSCIECGKMIEADPEVRRLALAIATVPGVDQEVTLYEMLEENIDRKLRGILSAREIGSRFKGPGITMVAVVDRRAEMLLVNVAMSWRRKQVRARIEAPIDLASMGAA